MATDDRRQYARLEVQLEVRYTVLPDGEPSESPTQDIGGGGFRLVVAEPLDQGTRIRADVTLPNEKPIPFIGEVVWSEKHKATSEVERAQSYAIGVRIIKIAPADRERIKGYVVSNL